MFLSPGKVLDRLSTKPPPVKRFKYTLLEQMALNYTLLESLSPEGTELHLFNAKFVSELRYINNILI